jgi:hypothetical protein
MATPYETLDELASHANDETSTTRLFNQLLSMVSYGNIPQSLKDCLNRAEISFISGRHTPITEAAVANAVNYVGPCFRER